MSRCRPCLPRREQVDRLLLISQITYWLPVLSDAELAAVASLAKRLGRAAERLRKARKRRDRS
jgi:hypothetical protein